MIYPTANDILRCIDQTLLASMDTDMPRMSVTSALATCRHLVRHVGLRIALEKPVLLDDIDQAGALLARVADYFESAGADHAAMVSNIRSALAKKPQLVTGKEDELDVIRERARELRELIYVTLAALQKFTAEQQAAKAYADTRQRIRDYMRYQIEQEARLIDPAFAGQGPRR